MKADFQSSSYLRFYADIYFAMGTIKEIIKRFMHPRGHIYVDVIVSVLKAVRRGMLCRVMVGRVYQREGGAAMAELCT